MVVASQSLKLDGQGFTIEIELFNGDYYFVTYDNGGFVLGTTLINTDFISFGKFHLTVLFALYVQHYSPIWDEHYQRQHDQLMNMVGGVKVIISASGIKLV